MPLNKAFNEIVENPLLYSPFVQNEDFGIELPPVGFKDVIDIFSNNVVNIDNDQVIAI